MEWNSDTKLYAPYLRASVRAGKGIGRGVTYKPFLRVRDVPSLGTASRFKGIKTHRVHHVHSRNEKIAVLLYERDPLVTDIREQFPIFDVDQTLALCKQFGVPHPYSKVAPKPFTLDVLLTCAVGTENRARSVKSLPLASEEEKNGLRVEQAWCDTKGIDWALVDPVDFTDDLLETLEFIRGWFRHRYLPRSKNELSRFAKSFEHCYDPTLTLGQTLSRLAKVTKIASCAVDNEFRYCCWAGLIRVDLRAPMALDRVVVLERDNDGL